MEIKLAIIDDDRDFLATFSDFTERVFGFTRPSVFDKRATLLAAMTRARFDVILVDLLLGRTSGCELIREIKELDPGAKILVLSGHCDDYLVDEALGSGADGYLLKTLPLREILSTVQSYLAGGVAMDPKVMRRVLGRFRAAGKPSVVAESLTSRESEILKRLASGRSYKEISFGLGISTQTVYSHAKRLFRKLGVRSKTEAVAVYLRQPGLGASAVAETLDEAPPGGDVPPSPDPDEGEEPTGTSRIVSFPDVPPSPGSVGGGDGGKRNP